MGFSIIQTSVNLILKPTNVESILTAYVIKLKYVNAEQWVDLEISEDFSMVKISMVSNPVVAAVEKNCVWFVKSPG